jgi:charged multivesicular body protein 1
LEGTVSKLEAQMSMLAMNKNIGKLTQQLQKTLSNNELLKASKVMEDFDKCLENLELQGNNMSAVMNQQTAQATPQNQVQDLLNEIADNQGMQLQEDLPGAPARLVEKQDESQTLEARMKSLQGP